MLWGPGLRSWCPPCLVGPLEEAGPGGELETSQKQMHFIDKATALEGMRQRPHLARATLGVGVLIHIEIQAELSLTY